MKKRNVNWGRVLAVLLTSAMLMQSSIIAWADEPSTVSEDEAARIAAEQSEAESKAAAESEAQSEAARIAAESEAARIVAEQSEAESKAAAESEAQSEAARLAAESEAAAKAAAESEAAAKAAAESEAAAKAAAESEAAAKAAAESEAAAKAAAESEAAAKAAAESEAAAKAAAESEAAAKAAAESEAAAKAAAEQSEAESKAAAENEAAEADTMIGVEVAPVTYRITFEKNSEEHGIIRVENQEIKKEDLEKYEKKVASNGEFIFTVQPDKGYDIKSVKIEDKDVPETKNENEYEIEPVIKDVEIKVEYEKLPETETEAADTEQSEAAEGSAETAPEDDAQKPETETEFKFMFQQVTLPLGGDDAWVTGADGENHSWQVLNENVISIIEQDDALVKIRANAAGEIFLAHTYALDGMNKMETFHVIVTDGTEEEAEPETGETMTEEAELETETEIETETETESELESESEEEYKTDFYFENEEISITVKALEEAQLPMDTELVAEKLAENSEAYLEAKAAADAQSGADPATSSYLFYDIKLVCNGKTLEPEKGMLTIQVEFKYTSSQNIYNIEDTENGKVAENVTADAEGNSLSSVDFEV